MRHRNSLSAFLSLGYFLDYRNASIDIDTSGVSKKRYADVEREDLVKTGVEFFRQAISASFEPNGQHLVPLSGGMDSRAVLAGLTSSEVTDPETTPATRTSEPPTSPKALATFSV